jgi:flagellar hook-basal body complex protein FliE
MDFNALNAARAYGQARPATAPAPTAADGVARGARDLAQGFARTLQQAETTAHQAMTGGADPHALVTALSEAQLAVETTVALRDRVVEAYLEILRMPV